MRSENIKVITFYEFKDMTAVGPLSEIRDYLKNAMLLNSIKGTVIIAGEGFNSTVCGEETRVADFVRKAESILKTRLAYKSSFCQKMPFRKVDVKIKPEIVTLKKEVNLNLGAGTHVSPKDWNKIVSDAETLVLDTRNDYEFQNGTFRGAINPQTEKFSDLPEFIAKNFDPQEHKRIAMFCTGGIRCEKFAPYMKQLGFEEVFQLEGGILKYLEEISVEDSLWEGDCFVFDDRRAVDHELKKSGQQ